MQVNDGWTVWPRRVIVESGHWSQADWFSCVTDYQVVRHGI